MIKTVGRKWSNKILSRKILIFSNSHLTLKNCTWLIIALKVEVTKTKQTCHFWLLFSRYYVPNLQFLVKCWPRAIAIVTPMCWRPCYHLHLALAFKDYCSTYLSIILNLSLSNLVWGYLRCLSTYMIQYWISHLIFYGSIYLCSHLAVMFVSCLALAW